MVGLSLEYLAPTSKLGQLVSLPAEVLHGLSLGLVFRPVSAVLGKAGTYLR